MTAKPSNFRKNKKSEKGFALLIAIFTILLLTAIGAGMVALTETDTSISGNFRDEQTAYFAAKAGIEEARDRLHSGSNTISGNAFFATSNLALPGQAGGVLYITNPNTTLGDVVTPWASSAGGNVFTDDEICSEVNNIGSPVATCSTLPTTGGWYTSTSASTSYKPASGPLAWKWVRFTAKTNLTSSGTSSGGSNVQGSVDGYPSTHSNYRVCWNGANEVAIPYTTACALYSATPPYQPVYVITALAQTPTGSRRMVQAETTMTTFPSIPGPLVFDGPNPTFSTPSSNAFQVNANNTSSPTNASGPGSSCPSGMPAEYAIGGFDGTSTPPTGSTGNLQTWTNANRPNNYVGLNNPNGTSNVGSVGNVSSQLGSLATVGGLQALTSAVTLIAGNENNVYTTNQSGLTNPGTIANPQVNVVEGNLTLSGSLTGAGILLVTGTLTMNGNPSYDGLILVVGQGAVIKNGGGNGTVDGAMLVANLYNSSGALLPSSGPPGSPSVTWNGGGTVNWNYDSCWSTAMSQTLAWRIVAMREIIR